MRGGWNVSGLCETLEEKRELLKTVNDAIKALLSGGVQSYTIGKRSLTRLNLNDLFAARRQLTVEIAAEETPPGLLGNTQVTYFDRR